VITAKQLVLTGGVGGAKFALGMAHAQPAVELTVLVNTGDDFRHLGLSISPDLDTLMYTLAGIVNTATGWGRADESWAFMAALAELGGADWFRLGDRDLATHVERSRRLAAGEPLSAITADFCRRFGIAATVLPMSDDPVHTRVRCEQGELGFQDYFVRQQAEPRVTALQYAGAEAARPVGGLEKLLRDPALGGIFIAPSNPWLSIAPILAVPAIRAALRHSRVPVIAISPLVGGQAVKGPTTKIMRELGIPVSATSIARYYHDVLDGFILDAADEAESERIRALDIAVEVAPTLMQSLEDRVRLAASAMEFAKRLADQHQAHP